MSTHASGTGPCPKMQYARLGASGLKTSRIILGCMAFGSPRWEGSPWTLEEDDSLRVIKRAWDLGINTWDTANTYSNGKSERILGRAMRQFSIPRSRVVIMTKLYYPVMDDETRPQPPDSYSHELVNQMGLSRKHIFDAVEASLERLGTSYIDVLQLHRLDRDTPPEETMRALHDLVCAGKVRYLGASSMYTWEFARLQYTAKMHGWTSFTSMQPFYNLLYREEEREMLPFCASQGVGVIPWSPLARGLLGKPVGNTSDRSTADAKTKKWFEDAELLLD
ncbi:voltage-gated potassium channel subunit beta-2 [Paraphoma chrysanthemicola]|nr:voltage-gated potassium channel subunit beta-2 [Paraphoma chrysanthemicola]